MPNARREVKELVRQACLPRTYHVGRAGGYRYVVAYEEFRPVGERCLWAYVGFGSLRDGTAVRGGESGVWGCRDDWLPHEISEVEAEKLVPGIAREPVSGISKAFPFLPPGVAGIA